ncbi:MAG: bacillithiol system redox-active protein YtxJ [Blastocatellia bacterium]
MMETLKELRSIEDLSHALEESNERPVLFFKHSLTCPISARAYNEFRSYLQQAGPQVAANLIVVQTARPVSDETSARLSLEHHSPQAILVRNGREVWNASHFAITAAALREAITNHSN